MTTRLAKCAVFAVMLGTSGCGSTPGAQPQDMSRAQHEQAAAAHEQTGASHGGAYDANARERQETCAPPYGGCWTSTANPTAQHKADAEKHKKMAADHRAAAQALREAEARACAGIAEDDRDTSPFYHREDIESVAPYNAATPAGTYRQETQRLHGAVITFRAVKGMTAEWLQRIIDCHLARNASMGFEMPEMSFCPLAVKGVRAKVTSTGNGFTVTVEADDAAAAQEILRRAQGLVGKNSG